MSTVNAEAQGWARSTSPLPATTYNPHDDEHWSFCTDAYCQTHLQSKQNSNYWPKAASRRGRRNSPCGCGQPHHPDLDRAIRTKHLNPKVACRAWSRGKRVCHDCGYVVNLDGHQERCSERTSAPSPPLSPWPSIHEGQPQNDDNMIVEDGSNKENTPPSEPSAQPGTKENPIHIHEDGLSRKTSTCSTSWLLPLTPKKLRLAPRKLPPSVWQSPAAYCVKVVSNSLSPLNEKTPMPPAWSGWFEDYEAP
jgi:hypothetical protein